MAPRVVLNISGMQSFVPKWDGTWAQTDALQGTVLSIFSLYLSAPGYCYQKYKLPVFLEIFCQMYKPDSCVKLHDICMNTFQMLDVTERTSSVVWDSSKPHPLCLHVTGYPRIWMLKREQTHMAFFRENKLYHIEREMGSESVMWLGNTGVTFEVDVPKESWCGPCFLSYN